MGSNNKLLQSRIDEMVSFLAMKELLPRVTGTLPWGWQQRLSLACANLHHPSILFLDEPTGSVDPLSRRTFWDFIPGAIGQWAPPFSLRPTTWTRRSTAGGSPSW